MKTLCWGIAGYLVVVFILLAAGKASASQTMSLVDEYRDGNQKVCVYSDGRNSTTTTKSLAGSCPSKHISR
ncbi:hypothetical protein CHUUTOTORO_00830 [Serratia phage vB_SmaM-ChuuTotoro]|nr:hypothetical protein CHUUTOTORO_00830 [Serratia phage vB_SmaM-ChuuTotoro]